MIPTKKIKTIKKKQIGMKAIILNYNRIYGSIGEIEYMNEGRNILI